MWPQRGQQQLLSWAKRHFCLHSQSKLQLSNNNNRGKRWESEWERNRRRGGGTICAHVPEHLRAIELTFAMLKPMGIFVCVCVCETVCTSKFKAGVKLCDETTRSTFTFHTSRVLRPKFHTSTHSLRVFNDGEMRAPIKCALAYATFPKNLICFDWVCDYFSLAKESRSQTPAAYIV